MSTPPPPESLRPVAARAQRLVAPALRHPWLTMLAILALGLLVLVLLWDWNWFKGPIERWVEARTGRGLHIAGDLDVDLGWTPKITAAGVRFGNAGWSAQPVMAAAERLEFRVELGPLLRGDIRIPELHLRAPRLNLEKGPDGRGNWEFGTRDGDGPRFRRVWIADGKLRFLDAAGNTDFRLDVATDPPAEAGAAPPIAVQGGGQWKGNEFILEGTAASPLGLRDRDSPYQVDIHARAGATRAHARGTLVDPLRLRDFDLALALSGQDLEDLYPLIGIATPPTPPYKLDGRFTREGTRWHYTGFTGTVGDSDLAGEASVDTAGDRPYLRARLNSRRLDFDDLAGFVGGAPKAGKGETSNPDLAAKAARASVRSRVLPDTAYNLEKLRAMDADVHWKATRIDAPSMPLDHMDAHLVLENGLLRLEPLDFGVADGTVRSRIRMDARAATIRTRADINARGLNIAKLLPKVELAEGAIGRLSGDATLAGHGNSVARMLGSSDGDIALAIGRGSISNLLMEMAGIDLAEIIKFKLQGDRLIPIRCAFGELDVKNGLMTARSLAFDTTDTILIGSGTINLREESLDLTIRPRPKDRSLLSLRSPLLVSGSFKDPQIRPDYKSVALRAAIALTLGTIAPPAALLGTLELGPGEDAQCGGAYAK